MTKGTEPRTIAKAMIFIDKAITFIEIDNNHSI